jgi:hypothetical protein
MLNFSSIFQKPAIPPELKTGLEKVSALKQEKRVSSKKLAGRNWVKRMRLAEGLRRLTTLGSSAV